MPDLRQIIDTFERISGRYDRHAALEQEVCRRLLERTTFNRRAPARILDLGCGTGQGSAELKRSFRKAQVIALDSSRAMLAQLRRRSTLLRPLKTVCADISALPFSSQSADLVFSNLASFWCADPMAMFSEFRRVLRPDGMLLFSTLAPGTFRELDEAWSGTDSAIEFPDFPDLLEIGDALMAAGFREPVMDTEKIVVSYSRLDSLLDELEATGMSLLVRGWNRSESRITLLDRMYPRLPGEDKLPLSFVINYGVAFGPAEGQPVKTQRGDIATFSVDALKSTARRKS
jgi:malonyl-CoA O-methyltransferase